MVDIRVPIGGIIVELHVEEGARVAKDTYLFTLERAKTLMIVRSTVSGTVQEMNVALGDQVDTDFVAVKIAEQV